ncbi:MAG: transposase [Candidimonas sp.]|nr:transposase [Candidimonas sp.]
MSEDEQILRVTAVHPSGRRTFDPLSKRRFVAACLAPGASVAQMSLDHGVNANLVWNWVRRYSKDGVMKETLPACLPQQSPFAAVRTEPLRLSPTPASATKVNAWLPNGVTLTLECSDARALTAIIGALNNV